MRVTMLLNFCFTSHCPLCTILLYTLSLFDGIHLQVLHHLFREDLLVLHLPPSKSPTSTHDILGMYVLQYTWGFPKLWTGE